MEENMRESEVEKEQVPNSENPDWKREKIPVKDIELDRENPRLDLNENVSQMDIIHSLFEEANIDKLIEGILESGRLSPGENIIVINEGGKYIVVEGNRRLCSLKCIIDPELIPKEKRDDIKEMIKNSNIDPKSLENIEVEVSPSRDAAQKIITARHTKYEIEKWSYVSKWRRVYKAFIKFKNIEDTTDYLYEDIENVKKYLKNYSLLQYVWDMPCWNSYERESLKKNDLKGSLIEWHITSIQSVLDINFDHDYKLESNLEDKKLEFVLEKLVRSFFLNGEPKLNTRTSSQTVKDTLSKWIEEYENENKQDPNQDNGKTLNDENKRSEENSNSRSTQSTSTNSKPSSRNGNKKSKKPELYFGSLNKVLTVTNQRLIRLTYELSKNDMKDRPATGIILARSLIESALLYRIDHKQLTNKLIQENKGKKKDDVRLNKVLQFCIENSEVLFLDHKNAIQSLKRIQSIHLKYMNSIVHGSWLDPSSDAVYDIASDTREMLRVILTDSP